MTTYRGGLPALKWLIKQDPEAALAVWLAMRDEACAHADAGSRHDGRDANPDDAESHVVPDEPLTSETMAEPAQDGPDEIHPEMLHEIRPSERDMFQALGWFEWPVTGRSEPLGWLMRCPCGRIAPAEGSMFRPAFDRWQAELAGMTFYLRPKARRYHEGGLLVSYEDACGNVQRPAYRASKPRGGKKPHRTKASAIGYIASKAAIASPLHAQSYQRPMSKEPALIDMYDPQEGVEEARDVLRQYGVDGSVPFDLLPFPATRHPTAIARGARFIAGISAAKQTASAPAPTWQEREVKPLGAVLDEVASRGGLADIGTRLGYRGGSADRAGGKALLAEGRSLVAANDNIKSVKIAA